MRVLNEIMKSKRFDDLLDKMNTCTIFLLVICSSFVLACLHAESSYLDLNSYNWLQNPIKSLFKSKDEEYELSLIEDETREEHVIIFDAGSTGTRIHVFTFEIEIDRKNDGADSNSITFNEDGSLSKRKKVILKSEHFKSITPGLSSYAEQPEDAAKNIKDLLKFANKLVDPETRKNTSINIIATAGLRLLPDEQSIAILDHIEQLLKSMKRPYKLTDNSIRILDGNSEGIFSWVTINFLLKKLHNAKKSVAVLDLGGGSTQVTFSPLLDETFRQSPEHFLIKRKILGEDEYLYTHSYLGFGLMATRKYLLISSINREKQYLPHEHVNLTHPCFPTGQTFSWSYQYVTYSITGIDGDCYQFINSNFKKRNQVKPVPELKLREIYAISYYYDRMYDVGKINSNLGQVSIYDYYLAAKHICGSTHFDTQRKASTSRRFRGQKRLEKESNYEIKSEDPFLCLDLTYIANLLNTGFGLQWRKKLTLGRKINNIEMSWALGSALSDIQ